MTRPFDAADYLKTPDDILVFLDEAYASGARNVVTKAISSVIRAVQLTEREACAAVAGRYTAKLLDPSCQGVCWGIADEIRARSDTSEAPQ